jgi:NAD+ kinase
MSKKVLIISTSPRKGSNSEALAEAFAEGAAQSGNEVEQVSLRDKDIRFCRLDRELPNADLIVCFGGDGTILHMAKSAARKGIPMLGVNIGTMGFMAELESTEMDQLARIATGDYTVDTRMMLDVTIQRDRDIIFHDICLNDVAITKGAIARIVRLGVKCDGVQAMECEGDGLIVATPTGSTAYSLSAGGPIVEPEAHNILITPICSHDVSSRCMVAAEKRVITVGLVKNIHRNAYLSVDGGKAQRLSVGDVATIRKSDLSTKLIRLKDRSFYDVLNMKFKYGDRG